MPIFRISGLSFYKETGSLVAGSSGSDLMKTSESLESQWRLYRGSALQSKFPYFNIGPEDLGIFELPTAGYISPRKFVLAQQICAAKQGCDVIRDTARQVTRINKAGELLMQIVCISGNIYLSKKVLLATGAFTTFRDLLGFDVRPEVTLQPDTVAKVEIGQDDVNRLR